MARNGQTDGSYFAVAAQERAARRRQERPLVRKLQRAELNEAVRSRLTKAWSPEQIAGRLKYDHPEEKQFHVSPQTVYTWLAQDPHREHWKTFLRRGGQRPKSPRSGQILRQVKIDGRPAEANERQRLGEFEGDTIVSRGKRSGLATLIARVAISWPPSRRTAGHRAQRGRRRTRHKIEHLLKELPPDLRHTATFE